MTDAGAPGRPLVAAAALLRGDGRVLLVRAADASRAGAAEGRWTLPAEPVADDETAEAALARLLRERLRVSGGDFAFAESVALPGAVANVFRCTGWSGGPRYSPADYADAAWAAPHAPGVPGLAEGVCAWLAEAFPAPAVPLAAPVAAPRPSAPAGGAAPAAAPASADELASELEAARAALEDAYGRIGEAWRDVTLDGGWAPVDLLAHCATVEAYYASEARRLAEEPGHTWRPFNSDQEAAEGAGRPRPGDRETRERLREVRRGTLEWTAGLGADVLAAYGNHAERGAVRVGERLRRIADHDRAHADQLAAMRAAAEDGGAGGDADGADEAGGGA